MTIRLKYAFMLALTCLIVPLTASAQSTVAEYLDDTDPILLRIIELNSQFQEELQPLREKKDLNGISQAVKKYSTSWQKLSSDLAALKVPADAKVYHQAISELVSIQSESNQLLSETISRGIKVAREVQEMKSNGASKEAMRAKVQEFQNGGAVLKTKITELKNQALALNDTLKSERQRLGDQVDETSGGD